MSSFRHAQVANKGCGVEKHRGVVALKNTEAHRQMAAVKVSSSRRPPEAAVARPARRSRWGRAPQPAQPPLLRSAALQPRCCLQLMRPRPRRTPRPGRSKTGTLRRLWPERPSAVEFCPSGERPRHLRQPLGPPSPPPPPSAAPGCSRLLPSAAPPLPSALQRRPRSQSQSRAKTRSICPPPMSAPRAVTFLSPA